MSQTKSRYFFQNQGMECRIFMNCGDGVTIVCNQAGQCKCFVIIGGEIYPESLVREGSLENESEYTGPQIFASYFLEQALEEISPEDKKHFANCFGIK